MKIINLILGLGTAIILTSLVSLGIETFSPAPEYPEFDYTQESGTKAFNCGFDDQECLDGQQAADRAYFAALDSQQTQEDEGYDKKMKDYDEKNEAYNRNFFVITNIIGLSIFLGGLLLLLVSTIATRSVAVGIVLAGMASTVGGYATSWWSGGNDKSEFAVGLLVAVIIIVASMWFLQQYNRRNAQQGSPS